MSILRNQSLNLQKAVIIEPPYHLNVLLEVQILPIKLIYFATRHDKTEILFSNVKCLLIVIDSVYVKQTLG